MKKGIVLWAGYLVALAAGFGLPVLSLLDRGEFWWFELILNGLAILLLLAAAFLLALIFAKAVFPEFWWLAQVLNDDIYEYDGIYFVGVRESRQKTRLNRIVFGVDEKMRPWDFLFGAFVLALLLPHLMGAYTAYGFYGQLVPQRPRLPETLHQSTLSSFPVMREWKVSWRADPALEKRVEQELARARQGGGSKNELWFRLAQLHLLNAFQTRTGPGSLFRYSPGDAVSFERGRGAQAVTFLNRILTQPELERAGWSRGAHALVGFFHLSEQDYGRAMDALEKALAAAGDGEEAGISKYRITLLAAQAAMLSGKHDRAQELLLSILDDDRLPRPAYALATEHFAGAMRLSGKPDRAREMLEKASDFYKKQNDRGGIARVRLRQAALAVEEGRGRDAARDLSAAASLARGLKDGFTLNMVRLLAQLVPAVP